MAETVLPPRSMSYEQISDRAARDQAAMRAEQERWLDLEQRRYALPRRRRLVQDMVA